MSSGYRPPSSQPKGRWAAHLHAQRKARNWSQTRAFEEVREGLGFRERSRSAYIAIDMGKRQPTAAEAEYLASVFGWPAEADEIEQPETDQAALVAALHAQTQAMTDLVARLGTRVISVGEAGASPVIDAATRKRRRAYWIKRAMAGMTVDKAMDRAEQPSSQAKQFRAWIAGELPRGANLGRFAASVNLPVHVLTDPPATDDERLVVFRREAIAEVEQLPALEPKRTERQRRSA